MQDRLSADPAAGAAPLPAGGTPGPAGPAGPTGLFLGLRPFSWRTLPRDMMAGLTLAALAVPEVMGYTRIAGTPVVTGLYTLIVPPLLFALLGSSRLLVVGADSATAAIMAATLTPLAEPGSAQWLAYAAVLALGCGLALVIARVARLAFLADFLSRTVLAGFLTGVGLQVAIGELPSILGISVHGHSALTTLGQTLSRWPGVQPAEVSVGVATLAFLLLLRRIAPRFPAALVAVVAAIGASLVFGWPSGGIAVVGPIQGGLPSLGLPDLGLGLKAAHSLAPSVLAMTVVILAQSAATSRAYAWKYNDPFSEERDMAGLAAANAGAALTGAFVVNGSPTKTQMVDSAGGRTQVAHLSMAAAVTAVVLFATGPIAALPRATLAAIVLLIGLDLVHLKDLRKIKAERPSEFWVALATAASVLVAGVEQAIVLAMVLSLIDHVRRGYRPHNSVVVRGADGHARLQDVSQGGEYAPGLLVYRFAHAMYYANAEMMSREAAALLRSADPPLRWFVCDMDAVDDVDFSAGATLASLRQMLRQQNVEMKFMRATPEVAVLLVRYGVLSSEGEGSHAFASIRQMRHAFEAAYSSEAAGPKATAG